MSFGENLQYLRKQKEITQEQLAEQLEVSRQSVSKWESGQSYPEMEKLLQICSMFHCSMDTLMQGDVSSAFAKDSYGYDKFKNTFSKMIAAGVGILLLGISLMMLLCGAGIAEEIATAVFFVLLIVSVMIFIVIGMQSGRFNEKHPQIEDFYKEYNKENNPSPEKKRRNELIGKLCGCIMLVATIAFFLIGFIEGGWEVSWFAYVAGGILCAIVAIALSRGDE